MLISLAISPDGKHLFAGANAASNSPGGIYEYDLATSADEKPIPTRSFSLFQNYPNPFNNSTTISFSIPSVEDVRLSIFTVLGELVRVIDENDLYPGTHHYSWDGTNEKGVLVNSGIFFVRLQTKNSFITKKMVLLK